MHVSLQGLLRVHGGDVATVRAVRRGPESMTQTMTQDHGPLIMTSNHDLKP